MVTLASPAIAPGRAFVSMRWGLVPSWWQKKAKETPAI
jgi:putative SOS response-associated peptidase YedK